MSTPKPWPLVATPHDDVQSGRFDLAQFAANLGAVDANDPGCPAVYRDPAAFFAATWPTAALRELLRHVCAVLSGGQGDRVLQLRTPFGGGKTHTLIALLHLLRSRGALHSRGLVESNWPDPGDVRVVVLPCLDLSAAAGREVGDGVHLRTLWGELAWRLDREAGYALVATADAQRVQPGQDALRRLFGGKRVLVLLDEVLTYIEGAQAVPVGESTLGRQTLAFLQHLTETVAAQPHAALVYSLQKSIGQALGNEDLLQMLDSLVSRVDAKREPVSGDDVLRVVQRRLFSELGPPEVRQAVADATAATWLKGHLQSLGESQRIDPNNPPAEALSRADRLRQRVLDAYPFHPELLDLMYHRWGALPTYQRTRGALQFLAAVVHAVHRRGAGAGMLIGPGAVPLDSEAVRQGLFSQVGAANEWTSVLAADVIGDGARCKAVDREVAAAAPTLGVLQPGTRLAQALVLYSFGARHGEDHGVFIDELLDAAQTPDAPRDVLEGPLQRLTETLLYLHHTGRRLRFDKKPNLNKLVDDAAKEQSSEIVLAKIRKTLEPLLGTRGSYCLWPDHHSEVSDRQPRFTVVFWPLALALHDTAEHLRLAKTWTEHCGPTRRQYRNALGFAVPGARQCTDAKHAARRALACAQLIDDRRRLLLSDDDVADIRGRGSRAEAELAGALRGMYSHVLLPVAAPIDAEDPIRIESCVVAVQHATQGQLVEAARDAVKLYVTESCTPAKLAEKLHLGGDEPWDNRHWVPAAMLVDHVFGNPAFPKLLGVEGLRQAIVRGIADGRLGWVTTGAIGRDGTLVADTRDVWLGRRIASEDVDFQHDSFIVSAAYANQALKPAQAQVIVALVPNSNDNPVTVQQLTPPLVVDPDGRAQVLVPTKVELEPGPVVQQGRRVVRLRFRTKGKAAFDAMSALAELNLWSSDTMALDVTVLATGKTALDEHKFANTIRGPIDELGEIVEG